MIHRMKLACKGWLLGIILTGAMVGGGCNDPAKQIRHQIDSLGDPELAQMVKENINAIGGIELWASVARIDGDAIMAMVGKDGGKTLIEQKHTLGLGKNPFISITGNEAEGTVVESINSKGQVEMLTYTGQKPEYQRDLEALYGADIKLRLIKQAIMGGVGLLESGYQLRYAGTDRQEGKPMHKLEASRIIKKPNNWLKTRHASETLVVWIDTQTYLVEKIWLRFVKDDDGNLGYLAVNVRRHEKTPGGYNLPRYLEFVRSNQYMQFSESPIMTVEYQRFIVEQLPDK